MYFGTTPRIRETAKYELPKSEGCLICDQWPRAGSVRGVSLFNSHTSHVTSRYTCVHVRRADFTVHQRHILQITRKDDIHNSQHEDLC
jgi:hypothetical protein